MNGHSSIHSSEKQGGNMNFQKELDLILKELEHQEKTPRLLLHSCCAPCSSYVLFYLSEYFKITVFYYNPNISPASEYARRLSEQYMLVHKLKTRYPISFQAGSYDRSNYEEAIKGMEHIKEGGERCFSCYELRLRESAEAAAAGGFDYFTTTLSISPMKNAVKLNEIGKKTGELYGVPYLPSDFKKRNGYQQSIALSKEYGLYRQDYCGCEYSKRERESRKISY